MGLFSTVLHIYKKSQTDVINGIANELQQTYNIFKINKIDSKSAAFQSILEGQMQAGIAYLITERHGNWITVIEVAVTLDEPFFLYELTNGISRQLNTYALSFHLHDSDVLLYNLDKDGLSLDGYNSDYQYFLDVPAEVNDILSQRHAPQSFDDVLPESKNVDQLNVILNEGYWKAFDDDALDEDGIPAGEYFVDEEDRFERIGKYLEIFSDNEYPFSNWYDNLDKLNLDRCYLLTGER
jgi:hypothetical protein